MSSNCVQCGAMLPAGAHQCPFCHAATHLGHAMHAQALEAARQNEARAQFERQQAMAFARGQLDGLAQASFLWSLGSMVVCCVPGPQIMALVRYASARAAARKLEVAVPVKATAGLVLSILSIVTGVSFLTWAIVRSEDLKAKADARIVEIDKQLGARAPNAPLDAPTACAIAERHVLTEGHDGKEGHYFMGFECAGKLTVANEVAELADLVFKEDSSSKKKRVNACFAFGSKWYVSALSSGRCAMTPTAEATATATASAPPTVAAPVPSARPRPGPKPAASAPRR